jgi:hypothetical protein
MRPLPADERNPLAHGDLDELILWLTFKEARDLLGLDTGSPGPVDDSQAE